MLSLKNEVLMSLRSIYRIRLIATPGFYFLKRGFWVDFLTKKWGFIQERPKKQDFSITWGSIQEYEKC